MQDSLDKIEKQISAKRNFDTPPLHLWNPALSGDIDIRISESGEWFHEGEKIKRESLVKLFASILRRETDGEYYLVTPAEKWRIDVALHPLVVVDFDMVNHDGDAVLRLMLNTGASVDVGAAHPLTLEPRVGNVAMVQLAHGLSALFTRSAWYRLAELAEPVDGRMVITSNGVHYALEEEQAEG